MEREIGRLGVEISYEDLSVQLPDGQGCFLPPRGVLTAKGERVSALALAAVHEGNATRHAFLRGVVIERELGLPIPDLPLVVESVLLRAMQLAHSGLLAEVEAILEHVAALREGRG